MEQLFVDQDHPQYMLFASPARWIEELLVDIQQAKQYIYIETFRFNDDDVGQMIFRALMERAYDGIDIRIIVDSWGTSHSPIFDEMKKAGIKVKFFKKIVFSVDIFRENHERNHRKIIAIDDHISYIGSANITQYCLKWRESILRIDHPIATIFKNIFIDSFENNRKRFRRRKYYKIIHYKEFSIIREAPSVQHQRAQNFFIKMINNAKESITIVTPYFLPSGSMRKQMVHAVKRGVKVSVIIPYNSDVKVVDYIRNIYLGPLYLQGIKIFFYLNANIHSKAILVDGKTFSIGSSNFDYRSFRYMYEINLSASNAVIASLLNNFINDTLSNCEPFNYMRWRLRSPIQKIVALLLLPLRKLL